MATIKVAINETQSNFLARTTAPGLDKNLIKLGWAVDEAVETGDMTKLIQVRNEIGTK